MSLHRAHRLDARHHHGQGRPRHRQFGRRRGRIEGKFAQAMENYVDNPDRTNAPTRKYCRISDSEIENALTYENEQPNIVVLVEQTMVKGWDYMRGMPPGGTLVINTHYTPDYMIRFVPGPERLAQLVCVDAAKLADHKWLYYRLGELGLDRLSTEGAAERSKAIAPDIAAPLIAAVVKTTGIVKMETIEPMIANKAAFRAALDQLHVLPLNDSGGLSTRGSPMSTKGTHIPDWLAVPFAGITPAPSQEKGQDLFPTGNWRAIRPVYRDKMPPCNNACGTNEKIQGYLDLVKRGKYLDAYALDQGRHAVPVGHRPRLLSPVRAGVQPRAVRRGDFDSRGRAVSRRPRTGAAARRRQGRAAQRQEGRRRRIGSGRAQRRLPAGAPRLRGHDPREIAESRRPQSRRHSRLGAPAGRARSRDRAPRGARHHDQDEHRGRQGRHLGRAEEELRRLRPGRRPHRAEQRPRRGRRQGRRALRAAVPARHRHGHVEGEAGPARRRHRRRQHRDRLRARGAPAGRPGSDDDHGRGRPRPRCRACRKICTTCSRKASSCCTAGR